MDAGSSQAAEAPAANPAPARVLRPDRGQRVWEDSCREERLPAEHPARVIWPVVQTLDLSAFYEVLRARGSDPGRPAIDSFRPAIDPQLLVAWWLYATVDGVGNGRKLDRRCRQHDAYRWLCGGVPVNYHTLNDFRVGQGAALDELLTRVITALVAREVVQVARISQDGKQVRASAGSSSFRRAATLPALLDKTRAYVEELKQLADDEPAEAARQRAAQARAAREKQARLEPALALVPQLQALRQSPRTKQKDRDKPVRVSSTDPEARKMPMPDGGVRPAYNLQFATDVGGGAVLGVDAVTSGSDDNCSGPLRAQVEQRTGKKVQEHLADQGYVDLEQIGSAEAAGVAMYVPLPKRRDGTPVTASRWDTQHTQRWRARMQTDAAQQVYQQRWATSERVNADVPERFGWRQLPVCGLQKVRCIRKLDASEG